MINNILKTLLIGTLCILSSCCCQSQLPKEESIISTIPPPMGWNSWICFGTSVTEQELEQNADYMAEHMKDYGWEYLVIDGGWYSDGITLKDYESTSPGQNIDEYGRLIPNIMKHPSSINGVGLKAIADYVHSKGLKIGLHVMRGIPMAAINANSPIKGTKYRINDIVMMESTCEWKPGFYGVDMSKPGAQEYYNSLFELYESWGIDYVKVDDLLAAPVYKTDEVTAIATAARSIERPMVLSLSPGPAPIENINHLRNSSHMWRISEDFWDNWHELKNQFPLCAKWAPYIKQGHYPDADMLPIGRMAQRAMRGEVRNTNFTPDEQYTMMTLWAMFRSPLMVGCNLPDMDDFTLKLLTNRDVININQYSKNNREVDNKDGIYIWAADSQDDKQSYVAVFNTTEQKLTNYQVDLKSVSQKKEGTATELWTKAEKSITNGYINVDIDPHACVVYKIKL